LAHDPAAKPLTLWRIMRFCLARDPAAELLTIWRIMRFARAAFGDSDHNDRWQAFCLAKQVPIRYTACRMGYRKLCPSLAHLIRRA